LCIFYHAFTLFPFSASSLISLTKEKKANKKIGTKYLVMVLVKCGNGARMVGYKCVQMVVRWVAMQGWWVGVGTTSLH